MKRCFKCGSDKPESDFYRHPAMGDGLLGKCKECTRSDVQKNYLAKRDRYVEYEKVRNRDDGRKQRKLHYQQISRKRSPEKHAARSAVGNALRDGRLIRLPCAYCGSEDVEAHHHDYAMPLDVKWVCFACHRSREHGQIVS